MNQKNKKSIFKRLKAFGTAKRRKTDSLDEEALAEGFEATSSHMAALGTDEKRQRFLERSLNRMRDLTIGITEMKADLSNMTQDLNDMRVIDNISENIRSSIEDAAKKIVMLEKMRSESGGRTVLISEAVYRNMEAVASFMPDGIDKLAEQEDLRKKIRYDLENLHSQREAIDYRKQEAIATIANVRGIALITGVGAVFCIIILLVLQLGFRMNSQIGYLIMAAILAVTMFTLFTRKNSSEAELSNIHLTEEKLVKIQNQVKIRYVNNVNLLDYYYTKYHTDSSKALKKSWEGFTKESAARKHHEKINAELEADKAALADILKQARVQNPLGWLRQASALSNKEEYEKIRYGLRADLDNLRRQVKEMEKNVEIVKTDIIEFANVHPEYEREILKAIGDIFK